MEGTLATKKTAYPVDRPFYLAEKSTQKRKNPSRSDTVRPW